MRKLIAVFLLIVFLINLSGIFIAFKIQQLLIRNEVMQLLQHTDFENKLSVIIMTPENKHLFEWEHEKEFRYNGVMYDVVKKKINASGAIEFRCFADKKETRLWSDLSELAKKNTSSGEALKNLVKFFSSVFLPTTKITVDFFSYATLIRCYTSAGIPFAESETIFPPPKLV